MRILRNLLSGREISVKKKAVIAVGLCILFTILCNINLDGAAGIALSVLRFLLLGILVYIAFSFDSRKPDDAEEFSEE